MEELTVAMGRYPEAVCARPAEGGGVRVGGIAAFGAARSPSPLPGGAGRGAVTP